MAKDIKQEAKRKALEAISSKARSEMGDKVKADMESMPMKKISVMAPDQASLEKGLEVAKKLSPKMEDIEKHLPDMEEEEPEDMDEEAEESLEDSEEPSSEHEDKEETELVDMLSTEEEIDKVMKMLEEKKKSLQK